ncbi:MAG: sulfotransferase family protein [Pseudolabrys sp.]
MAAPTSTAAAAIEPNAIERALFDALADAHGAAEETNAVFILGAPRTGSTLTYQALCSRFGLPYIANITNDHFASTPIVGLALQKSMPVDIAFASRFGKTDGPFQPSEGSALMIHWFGMGNPPALKSAAIRFGFEQHFIDTLRATVALFAAPLVIKNAWNCFRVPYLAQALPKARFIWTRRDIADAAKSDLDARYKTKGDPTAWNSASPANIDQLQGLSPGVQVIENQYAFNRAIHQNLERYAPGRWLEIWYEDIQKNPDRELNRVGAMLGRVARSEAPQINLTPSRRWKIDQAEERAIDDFLAKHSDRFATDRCPA